MIADLRLQHFRSYGDNLFEFDEGVNIIVGPNASGKTNLLEGVLVLCRGSSYRASDRELIQYEAEWARLDGHVNDQERNIVWRSAQTNPKAQYTIAGTTLQRLPLTRQIPAVVFEPQHLQLLTQSPELRRQFIDDMIEQITPGFSTTRRHYRRALAQRNRLLKQPNPSQQIFVWDVRLSELGGEIARARRQFIEAHAEELTSLYGKLAGKKHRVHLRYETKIGNKDYTSQLLKMLQERTMIDQERGYTTVGPHRDDIVPLLDDKPIMTSASRGETRTVLLALKLLEVHTLESHLAQKPVLLLDDVFSELDGARRRALTEQLRDHQTFITTTDADIVVQHFLDNCRIIPTTGS